MMKKAWIIIYSLMLLGTGFTFTIVCSASVAESPLITTGFSMIHPILSLEDLVDQLFSLESPAGGKSETGGNLRDSTKAVDMKFGLNGGAGEVNSWLDLSFFKSSRSTYYFVYERPEWYEIGVNLHPFVESEAGFEIRVGRRIGLDHHDAVLVGFTDQTRPFSKTIFYGKIYYSYFLDDGKFADDSFWEAGAVIGNNPSQLNLSLMDGPGIEEWYRMEWDFEINRRAWVLGVDRNGSETYYKVGLRYRL